jgi:hypothetical protein
LPPSGRLAPAESTGDLVLDRAEYQIRWYSSHADRNRIWYTSIKLLQVVAGALVPFGAGIESIPWPVTGSLGGAIVVLEGVQQLFRFHDNWVRYRATTEAMTREKYLYGAHAGGYATAADPRALLAERIEALTAQEASAWATLQQSDGGGSSAAPSAPVPAGSAPPTPVPSTPLPSTPLS